MQFFNGNSSVAFPLLGYFSLHPGDFLGSHAVETHMRGLPVVKRYDNGPAALTSLRLLKTIPSRSSSFRVSVVHMPQLPVAHTRILPADTLDKFHCGLLPCRSLNTVVLELVIGLPAIAKRSSIRDR